MNVLSRKLLAFSSTDFAKGWRWCYMALLLIFLAALSSNALAQTTFTGFIVFQDDDGNTHAQMFENYDPPNPDGHRFNRVIPGYYGLGDEGGGNHTSNGLWHLSCSDDLSDNIARVELGWYSEYYGQSGLTSPATALPDGFTEGEIVHVINWGIERDGPGGDCGATLPDVQFQAFKTIVGTYDREYKWTIDKTVTPASADIFFGDSKDFDYTVDVEPDGFENDYSVSGTISGQNNGEIAVTVTQVSGSIPGGSNLEFNCEGGGWMNSPVALALVVAPGGSLSCDFRADSDGSTGQATARVDFLANGIPGFREASAALVFPANPANETYNMVNVTDQFDGGALEDLGSCTTTDGTDSSGDGCSSSYSRTLDCSDIGAVNTGDSGSKSNTATIVETGDDDMESVMLTCHALDVTKTADPEFTREYFWVVDKVLNDDEPIEVMEGQSYELDYSVFVGLDDPAYEDSDWSLSGDITVSNPAPIAATVNSLSDVFTGGTGSVECGSDAPWVIAAGGTLDCTYSGDSDGTTPGTNTATATQQNYAYDSAGAGTPNGTTDYQGTAGFSLGNPTSSVNACVDVWDVLTIDEVFEEDELLMLEGALEGDPSLCYYDAPAEFSYTYEKLWFPIGSKDLDEPFCEILVDNEAFVFPYVAPEELVVADLPEGEWLAYDIVSALVENAECEFGCTLTQGYWKTHSAYGPAPYDETWAMVGEDTPFFISGLTWHEILWTPPKGGNAYIQLAHQWIAAYLNQLNEASSTPEVDDAMQHGWNVFLSCEPYASTTHGPGKGKKGKQPVASCEYASDWEIRQWASTLDRYNNGDIGPGHCSENEVRED